MKIFLTIVALCMAACPLPGATASSARLQVTGRIVPDACQARFSAAGAPPIPGTAAAGAVAAIGLRVSCVMPTMLAIRLVDNRPPVAAAGMMTASMRNRLRDTRYFGLRDAQGRHAGVYIVSFSQRDGASAPALQWQAGGWTARAQGQLRRDTLYTWGRADGHPDGLREVAASFDVEPLLERASDQVAPNETGLDGSATIELVYL